MAILAQAPGVAPGIVCAHSAPRQFEYLADISIRDATWDVRRAAADVIAQLYFDAGLERHAFRMDGCSGHLEFVWDVDDETGESRLRLKEARFCRVRNCPVCNWRRSLLWLYRALTALPRLIAQYPAARFLLLTLTVPNPLITELRSMLKLMSESWHRLQQYPEFAHIMGFVRATEVSLGKTGPTRCHPHYHALLMVDDGYFSNHYVTRSRWLDMWRKATRLPSITQVDIRAVKPRPGRDWLGADGVPPELSSALPEVLKYATKPSDFQRAGVDWFRTYCDQTHKTRFLATGGVLKDFLRENDVTDDDLIAPEGHSQPTEDERIPISFDWHKPSARYRRPRF